MSGNLLSQNTERKSLITGFYMYVPFEFQPADFTSFNDRIKNLGYATPKKSNVNVGIGMQYLFGKGILDMAIAGSGRKLDAEMYQINSTNLSLTGNFGYNLLKNDNFSLHPFLGFKMNGYDYIFRNRDKEEISFDDYFKRVWDYKKVSYSRAHLDLGIGFSYMKTGMFGVRAGYLLPLGKGYWTNDDNVKFTDSPTIDYKYYVKFIIGFGGNMK